jgi:hypothetical protein
METTWTTAISRGFASLLLTLTVQTAAQERAPTPSRDPALQSAIREVLSAADESGFARALEGLRARSGPEHRTLVPQLLLFSIDATDTREAMAFGALVAALRIPPRDVVGALVPLLESSDEALRTAVGGVLSEYEDRSVDRGPSFSVYRPILEPHARTGEGWPSGLVRYLYETDPGAAFLLLLRLHVTEPAELKPLLWAEHVVEEARWKRRFGFLRPDESDPAAAEQLLFLARHAYWWARLLAAEVLRQEPAFRTDALVAELHRDTHPLVRAVAAKLAPSDRPR